MAPRDRSTDRDGLALPSRQLSDLSTEGWDSYVQALQGRRTLRSHPFLVQEAESSAVLRGCNMVLDAVYRDRARIWLVDTGEAFHECRFSCAVVIE